MDVQKIAAKYTVDVIAEAAFGVDSKAFESNSLFEERSKTLVPPLSFLRIFRFILSMSAPTLAKYLGIQLKFMNPESDEYFSSLILNSMKHRQQNGLKGNDFIQLLMEARDGQLKKAEQNELKDFEKDAMLNNVQGQANFDNDSIIAQLILFFLGGFDTTKAVLTFALYEIALNEDVQQKLLEEIENIPVDSDGNISYESVTEMEYLDKVISGKWRPIYKLFFTLKFKKNGFTNGPHFLETLRLFPAGFKTERTTNRTYRIPGTDIDIEKDCVIQIPICAIHRDPAIYPNPEKFDPERFSPENKAKRSPYTYIPFGHGPRNCIGSLPINI